jgi:hypothetical protein
LNSGIDTNFDSSERITVLIGFAAKEKYIFSTMSMAAAGSLKGIGVPVKLLHEAEGHIVTVSKSN